MIPKVFLSGKAVITSVIRTSDSNISPGKITIELSWLDNDHDYNELSGKELKGYKFILLGEEIEERMKCIILIRGVSRDIYNEIRDDLIQQMQARQMDLPLFALLPSDYTDIDVLWLDEEMEKDNFLNTLKVTTK